MCSRLSQRANGLALYNEQLFKQNANRILAYKFVNNPAFGMSFATLLVRATKMGG